ncbi:MAG: peptide chain release factor N(5)-glutamine methyltransferase [Planctomycetota bacterium]|jgi:release factor glutamine methyltransferase
MSSAGHGARDAETWTTRKLLEWMTQHFAAKNIDTPRVVAEMLLSHVIGCDRLRLYMEVDRPAQPLELSSLHDLVARAGRHEPVQYLVGHAWFFGRQFAVDTSVFIPRPCTETLVENVLRWLRAAPGHARPVIADVGTGSGCIGVSLALDLDQAHVVATDVAEETLAVARANADRHGVVDRIEFRNGPGLDPLRDEPGAPRFDVVCSNPPYISDEAWKQVAPNVREYEPARALRSGRDGLDAIRPLIAGAGDLLRPGGRLAIEIADSQRDAVMELVDATGQLGNGVVLKDHEGLWRVLMAERLEK